MAIKTIPLSRLETDLKKTLNECTESGQLVIVEMPDQRLLAIQSLDPQADDILTDELLAAIEHGVSGHERYIICTLVGASRSLFIVQKGKPLIYG